MARTSMAQEASPSLWDIKPWWCQPWSILLTGFIVPTVAWLVLHRLWIVIPITVAVLMWWWLFLYVVPKSYAEAEGWNSSPQENSDEGR